MSIHKLIRIEKQTDNKWLNIYKAVYETEKGEFKYEFASRRTQENLVMFNKKTQPDAVRVVPYFIKNGKTYVVITMEYRYALNRIIYGVPAGLIDKGETPEQAAVREVMEEAGAKVIKLNMVETASYTSAGLTDESLISFEAEVELLGKQRLEDTEDIKLQTVEVNNIPEMLDKYDFALQSKLLLRAFYYRERIKQLE
ncbi:MAG: NUDIX hydrolase, partial [Clostridia bacterium]|nr:NUDIX hydrolase [Clostridia bacterium]